MVDVVKTTANVGIEYPCTARPLIEGGVDGFDCVHCTSSRSEAVRVGLKTCFPFWFEGGFDDCLHHAVTHGGYAQRSLFVVALGDVDPSNRLGLVTFEAQAVSKQLQTCFRGVAYHAVNACGVFALVFRADSADGKELVGSGSDEELLKVLDLLPFLSLGSKGLSAPASDVH